MAQLDACSVALHFKLHLSSQKATACSKLAFALSACSSNSAYALSSIPLLGDFGTHDLRLPHGCRLPKPRWQVLAILEFGCHVHRSCHRRIFCCQPFALQGLHRFARHPALSVALPGTSAAIAAAVRPRSSPNAGVRKLFGSGGPRCHLQDHYTTGGTRPGRSVACLCRAYVDDDIPMGGQRRSGGRVAR